MIVKDVHNLFESWAHLALQEDYDNAGLITGHMTQQVTGILCSLDVTEEVVEEAIQKKCNLVISHHPIVFSALKKFSGNSYVERTIVMAIKNGIAIYAIHTNLDNISTGVNFEIAARMSLKKESLRILAPKSNLLLKLYTYVPQTHADAVKQALFIAGAGTVGLYEECSFSTAGRGSFKPLEGSSPFIGTPGDTREDVDELKVEVVLQAYKKQAVLNALFHAHPYETVAYELIELENEDQYTGSGMVGELEEPMEETSFLAHIKKHFGLTALKHTAFLNKPIRKVAFCGGAGFFLLRKAISQEADVFITSDIKYHEFFDADRKILLVDIGHWESEQFTMDLIIRFLQGKIPTFAVLKTEKSTNPVHYFI